MDKKIEQIFDDEIWKVANGASQVKIAVSDAREIMKAINNESFTRDCLMAEADYWLSKYGE